MQCTVSTVYWANSAPVALWYSQVAEDELVRAKKCPHKSSCCLFLFKVSLSAAEWVRLARASPVTIFGVFSEITQKRERESGVSCAASHTSALFLVPLEMSGPASQGSVKLLHLRKFCLKPWKLEWTSGQQCPDGWETLTLYCVISFSPGRTKLKKNINYAGLYIVFFYSRHCKIFALLCQVCKVEVFHLPHLSDSSGVMSGAGVEGGEGGGEREGCCEGVGRLR